MKNLAEGLIIIFRGVLGFPIYGIIWNIVIVAVNSASLLFLQHLPGRLVIFVWLGGTYFMANLAQVNGFNRLLGVTHLIFWPPVLIYIYRVLPTVDMTSLYGQWLVALFMVNIVSLVIDLTDVVRYLLGDR